MLDPNQSPMQTHGSSSSGAQGNSPFSQGAFNNQSFNPPTAPPQAATAGGNQGGVAASAPAIPTGGFIGKQIRGANAKLLILNALLLPMGAFIAFVLPAQGSKHKDDIFLYLFGGVFILIALWNLGQLLRRMMNSGAHPTIANLAQYGPAHEVAAHLDREMQGRTESLGAATITQSWLVLPSAFRTNCVPLEGIVWFYKKVTQHYHNGIPTGKSYALVVSTQTGQQLEISSKKKGIDDQVNYLAERAPWALAGHTPELERIWKQERPAMIQAVAARRQEFLNSPMPVQAMTTQN